MQIVGIKFKQGQDIASFDAGHLNLKVGTHVICETENGLAYGVVANARMEHSGNEKLFKVLRVATADDKKKVDDLKRKNAKALESAKLLVKKHALNMHLVDAEYSFDKTKLTFNFVSDDRVDFRELLKSMAGEFGVRIELRQIGARDEAKIVGGYGPCGRRLCCSNHLKNFDKVSIKMAKDQNVSLNPASINGMCNRLKCCLAYEQNDYAVALASMPKLNSKVLTPDGEGVVTFNNVMTKEVSVKIVTKDGEREIKDYALGEIKFDKKS